MPVSTSCPVLVVILGRSWRWWKTNGRRMTSNVTQISLKVDVTVNIHMNFKCINYVKLNFMTPSPSTFKHLQCSITMGLSITPLTINLNTSNEKYILIQVIHVCIGFNQSPNKSTKFLI